MSLAVDVTVAVEVGDSVGLGAAVLVSVGVPVGDGVCVGMGVVLLAPLVAEATITSVPAGIPMNAVVTNRCSAFTVRPATVVPFPDAICSLMSTKPTPGMSTRVFAAKLPWATPAITSPWKAVPAAELEATMPSELLVETA